MSEDDVAELNTHLLRGRTPANRGWSVRIPEGTRVAFEASFPEMYRTARLTESARPALAAAGVAGTGGSAAARTHRVLRGETLTHIARRHGVSVDALRRANGNVDPRRLRVGQTLRVPSGSGAVASTAAATSRARYHRVARGENLSVIARRYGVTVRQIQSWNGLRGSTIQAGQRLRVG